MNRFPWLPVLAAIVTGTAARAQLALPQDINLFGDELVQKLPEGGRGRFIAPGKERAQEKAEGYRHTLLFHDGRQFRGELVEVTKDEIVWRRADAGAELRFPRSEVRRVALAPQANAGNPFFDGGVPLRKTGSTDNVPFKPVAATVKLPGGDWLFGNVTSADGESFALDAGSGSVTVARGQIEWLHFGVQPAPACGFSGSALAMEGWLPSSTALEVKDGLLTVNDAWIGRAVSPPPRFEVAFEVPADSEEGTRLWLQPFGPQPNCYGTGTVELRFGRKALTRLLFIEKFERQSTPLPPEAQEEKGPASYRVFYDGFAQRVSVWRNGRPLGAWKFAEQKGVQGNVVNPARQIQINGICFDREDRGEGTGTLKFHRIRVQPWDGVEPRKDAVASANDRLSIGKAAAVEGRLDSVTDRHVVFSGEEKPRQPGMTVQFAGSAPALADAEALLLGAHGEVSAAALEVRDGVVRCRTTFAPALELPASTLHAIAFPKRPAEVAPPADMLVFKNGDELPGTLLGAERGAPVRWRMTGGQEIEFQSGRVAGVRLTRAEGAAAPSPAATLELRSGEQVRGEFVALDAQRLRLRHAQLGMLTIPRDQLARLYPNPRLEIWDGARDPAAWLQRPDKKKPSEGNARAWLYFDGTYVLRQEQRGGSYDYDDMPGLQREVSAALDRFEVRGEGTFATNVGGNFGVQISVDGGMALQAMLSPEEVQLIAGQEHNWRNIPLRDKLPDPSTRLAVRIFVDARTGRTDLFVNGVPIARARQNAGDRIGALEGKRTVRFLSYSNNGATLVFSNLWIGPWTGELPGAGADPGAVTALANGDMTPGAPTELRDGKLLLETEIGPLELAADKVLAVDFGGVSQPGRAAARARLTDGSVINLDAFRWEAREVVAHSATLGDLRLPAGTVSELVFDPAPLRAPTVAPAKKLAQKATPNAEAEKPQ